jgi:hypothetical protein
MLIRGEVTAGQSLDLEAELVKSNLHPETRDSKPGLSPVRASDLHSNIDSVVALASEAIRYADQKK